MAREYEWEKEENEEIMRSFEGAYAPSQQPESYRSYLKDIGVEDENYVKMLRSVY